MSDAEVGKDDQGTEGEGGTGLDDYRDASRQSVYLQLHRLQLCSLRHELESDFLHTDSRWVQWSLAWQCQRHVSGLHFLQQRT